MLNIMKSSLIEALAPIMFLSKMLGLIRFSCSLDFNSMLYSSSSTWRTFMDILQIAFYLMCTYVVLQLPHFPYRYINLIRHWAILVTLRFAEEWIIKLTNGIIVFDRNFHSLPPSASSIRTPSRYFWLVIIVAYFVSYACIVFYINMFFLSKYDTDHFIETLFSVPRIADFAMVVTLCFYLGNLGSRFLALNTFWKRLVAGLLTDPGDWTTEEIAMLVECVRLLHANLSDLLRVFNRAFGFAIVVFIVCVIYDLTLLFFVVIFAGQIKLDLLPSVVLDAQDLIYVVFIFSSATWVSEQKKTIILHLRCNRITNLSKDVKIQIQLFMDQILSYEITETLACGLLNYKLKLLIPMIIMLIQINATIIQMKDQPYLKFIIDDMLNNGPQNE